MNYPDGTSDEIPVIISFIDNAPPIASITADKTDPTNTDVTLTLKTDEPIQTPSGWTKVDDKTYTKIISQNENVSVTITDIAGNPSTSPVVYNVTNIDKKDPTIDPIPNKTFPLGSAITDITPSITDNTTIKSIDITHLPDGLIFDPTTGKISGTPTKA